MIFIINIDIPFKIFTFCVSIIEGDFCVKTMYIDHIKRKAENE